MRYPLNIRNERQLKSTLGVNSAVFEGLVGAFESYLEAEYHARLYLWYQGRLQKRPSRKTKAKLSSATEQVSFVLYYLKNYSLLETFAERFNMDKGTASNNIELYLHRLQEVLGDWGVLPRRSFADSEDLASYIAQHNWEVILLDATERLHHRPKDDTKQRALYSGKKKPTA